MTYWPTYRTVGDPYCILIHSLTESTEKMRLRCLAMVRLRYLKSVKMEAELLVFAFFTTLVTVDGAITSSPEDIEVCVGTDATIPWNYDDADDTINSVVWTFNTTTDIMTYFGGGGTRDPENGYNVIAANNFGSITITNAQRNNTGKYEIVVTASQTTSDQVDLLVCESASDLKGTKAGLVMQCTANLGEPEATLYIK
ncbi:uncharacterized protein LOC132758507, partial [Ruditapes philippinarum]|uniref:uncharacterized protein LOC132758507 n=1 Tax=Ruditapes philippinarum TaxID=129788 RepID=UPI00295AFAC8